jgi:hypothetical protein
MKHEIRSKRKLPKQLFIVEAEAIREVLRRAGNQALLMHKRAGNPIVTWKDGKVVWIPAEEIEIPPDTLTDES